MTGHDGPVHLHSDGRVAGMIAGLVGANLLADPAKRALLDGAEQIVDLIVTDADEQVRLRLGGGTVHVCDARHEPGVAMLRLEGSEDVLLALSTVPLRLGLPDLLRAGGRGLATRWLAGGLRIHGLPGAAPQLRTVLRLLTVLG